MLVSEIRRGPPEWLRSLSTRNFAGASVATNVRSSLAIPIECYRGHADEFLRYGRIVSRPRRAWLGVYAHGLDEGVVIARCR